MLRLNVAKKDSSFGTCISSIDTARAATMATLVKFIFILILGFSAAQQDAQDNIESVADDVNNNPEKMLNEGNLPSREELLGMLDSMAGLTDEDRETLRKELIKDQTAGGQQQLPFPAANDHTQQFLLLFALLGSVALIFAFFAYKLQKSLTDRERKRAEKRASKKSKKRN